MGGERESPVFSFFLQVKGAVNNNSRNGPKSNNNKMVVGLTEEKEPTVGTDLWKTKFMDAYDFKVYHLIGEGRTIRLALVYYIKAKM